MVKQVDVNGEHVLPLLNGTALVASKSEWGVWHVVKNGKCDCKGFAHRQTCRHLRIVALLNQPVDRSGLFLPERPVEPRSATVPPFAQFFGVAS